MQSLPQPLPLLIYLSLAVSIATTALAFAGLSQGLPVWYWLIPVAFAVTLPYHLVILLLARAEPHGSDRLFSLANIMWGFGVATLWTVSFGIGVVTAALHYTRPNDNNPKDRVQIYIQFALCACSLVESAIVWSKAMLSYKERRRITYSAKWRFANNSSSQTWSFSRTISR